MPCLTRFQRPNHCKPLRFMLVVSFQISHGLDLFSCHMSFRGFICIYLYICSERSWVILAHELFGHMIDKRDVLQFTSCKPDESSRFELRDAIADEEFSSVTFGVPITKQMLSRVVLSTNSGAPTKLLRSATLFERWGRRNLKKTPDLLHTTLVGGQILHQAFQPESSKTSKRSTVGGG